MLAWYYNRLKTLGIKELAFRVSQVAKKKKDKISPYVPKFKSLDVLSYSLKFKPIRPKLNLSSYPIFGINISLEKDIDFHLDITSGKRFPLTFSKDIDTRSNRLGDAKVVWEINRLQFLLPIVIKYRETSDVQHLNKFVAIMTAWNNQNPYLKGVNWYSNIEVNIRLLNWYWCWVILNDDKIWQLGKEYEVFRNEIWLPLIYKHCHYSYRNPSYYSSANNHLISEYAGLFVASTIWKFPEADKWLSYAKTGLEKEIILQNSINGVNKEEASEYIQFIADFFLIAYVAGQHHGIEFSAGYKEIIVKMCTYINDYLDIKGNFPKYGDEDDGKIIIPSGDPHENNFVSILNTAALLFDIPDFKRFLATDPDLKFSLLTCHKGDQYIGKNAKAAIGYKQSSFYKDEGHFIFRKQTKNGEIYLHFNAAPLGFLSIAAHGHADALSVIVTLDGIPFIVDPGTYTYYADSKWRNYYVSTNAHNTLTIDSKNQAKQAGAMMWVKHYKTKVLSVSTDNQIEAVTACHDGYEDIGCIHTRTVEFDRSADHIVINDTIEVNDGKAHEIYMPWHLHPGVNMEQSEPGSWILTQNTTNKKIKLILPDNLPFEIVNGSLDPITGWYSESFLKNAKTNVIAGKIKTKGKLVKLKTVLKIK